MDHAFSKTAAFSFMSRPVSATLLALLLTASMVGVPIAPCYAQALDNFASEESTEGEPSVTSLEDIEPGGPEENLPGSEPIYDQGVTVTTIVIEGNDAISDDEIQDIIETKPGSLYSKRRLKKDLQLLFETGWFTEKLRAIPIATKEGIKIKYVLQENPVVTNIEFDGNTLVTTDVLTELFKNQLNRPQNVNLINKAIENVESTYRDKGYVLARVEDIDEPESGHIKITVTEGVLSKIEYEGNRKTRDKVVERAMAQKVGEVYNEQTVAADMKRVFSTQAFSDVRRVVKADPNEAGKYILVIELDEKKTGAISVGGGLDTGTGVFGSVGFSDPNFLGRGQSINVVGMVGSGVIGNDKDTLNRRIYQFQSNWFNPSISEDSLVSMGASLNFRELGSFNVPLAIERRFGGEVNFGRPIETVPGASMGVGIGLETTDIREGASEAKLMQRAGITRQDRADAGTLDDGTFAYITPSVGIDTRDNRLNPSSGWLNTVGLRAATGIGNDSYWSASTNLRRYLRITDSMNFSVNAQGGSALLGNIPQFDMFRLGGTNSVRGFQEGGIGVGQAFVSGTTELRTKVPYLKKFDEKYPFYDMVSLVAFADAGKLFDRPEFEQEFGRPGYGISFGGGLRLNIPGVGPLRFDYGVPIGGNKGKNIRNIHFGVGQKF